MGGGQGNAFTGQLFVIYINDTLKDTETLFPGVEVKAIQDDITIFAPPEKAWDALNSLCDHLMGDLDLKVNRDKCKCFGTTPETCAGKPDWLKEP